MDIIMCLKELLFKVDWQLYVALGLLIFLICFFKFIYTDM